MAKPDRKGGVLLADFFGMVFLVMGLLLAGMTQANAGLPAAVNGQALPSLADVLEPVIPAVVNITTTTIIQTLEHPLLSDPFFSQFFNFPQRRGRKNREQKSLGSGVVVDAHRGLILTNHHVINKADQITVTLRDGRSIEAKLVGLDPETDIAVIQIHAKNLQDLPLGDSDKLRVGDFLVAIGNPFGLGQTVTSGIVSALGRKGLGIKGYEDFIQTDASINPGNSGGALVNLRGELVGINTAILARGGGNVGIGFAIPVNMARQVMAQLIEYGEVRRGLLGIQAQDLTDALATALGVPNKEGVVISLVTPGSSAAKSGILRGDVITKANAHPVRDVADLRNIIGLSRPGEQVDLTFIRDGRVKKAAVVIADAVQDERLQNADSFALQMRGKEIDDRLQGAFLGSNEGKGRVEGIYVLGIKSKSVAWNIGLRKGDWILSVNRRAVVSFRALQRAMRKAGDEMLVHIWRGNKKLYILVR